MFFNIFQSSLILQSAIQLMVYHILKQSCCYRIGFPVSKMIIHFRQDRTEFFMDNPSACAWDIILFSCTSSNLTWNDVRPDLHSAFSQCKDYQSTRINFKIHQENKAGIIFGVINRKNFFSLFNSTELDSTEWTGLVSPQYGRVWMNQLSTEFKEFCLTYNWFVHFKNIGIHTAALRYANHKWIFMSRSYLQNSLLLSPLSRVISTQNTHLLLISAYL